MMEKICGKVKYHANTPTLCRQVMRQEQGQNYDQMCSNSDFQAMQGKVDERGATFSFNKAKKKRSDSFGVATY